MKASELRIGNYVQLEGLKRPIKVSIIDTTETSTYTKAKPIPLNEEWLIKFGFKPEYTHWLNGDFTIDKSAIGGYFLCDIDIHVAIKYVHTLQNLYFALTGGELTLKP